MLDYLEKNKFETFLNECLEYDYFNSLNSFSNNSFQEFSMFSC